MPYEVHPDENVFCHAREVLDALEEAYYKSKKAGVCEGHLEVSIGDVTGSVQWPWNGGYYKKFKGAADHDLRFFVEAKVNPREHSDA